jgi:hypothetical protein
MMEPLVVEGGAHNLRSTRVEIRKANCPEGKSSFGAPTGGQTRALHQRDF